MLPPLANVLAIHHADPSEVARLCADMESSGEFDTVWSPAPGWTAASRALPLSVADDARIRAAGLIFAEGRDVLLDAARAAGGASALAAFTEHSPHALGRYAGDFGFVRFHGVGSATVVRSCGGLVPFYVYQGAQCTLISTRLGDAMRYLPVEPKLDYMVNALWTTGHCIFPDGRTFFERVSILPPGTYLRVDSGRAGEAESYWDPSYAAPAIPTPAMRREHAERLRAQLLRVLERDLHPGGGNLLTLSGGVDSCAIAALAVLRAGRRISTFSLLPSDDSAYAREMSYIQPLAEQCRFDRRWEVRVGPDTMMDLLPQAPPIAFHVIHPALCALQGIAREWTVRILIGGEFADEVCGSARTLPDWAAATSSARILSDIARRRVRTAEVRAWLSHRRWRVLRRPLLPMPDTLPDFVRSELRDEYDEWFRRQRRSAYLDARRKPYLARCVEAGGWVAMNWEATSALGVRRVIPFMAREMLELAFECHPDELVGGTDKKLLRAALKDDVPALNLNRPDKGAWGGSMPRPALAWTKSLREPLDRIIRPEWFPQPPAFVPYNQARGLLQLALFTDRCTLLRRARPLASSRA